MSQENLNLTSNDLEQNILSKEIPSHLSHLPKRSIGRHHQLISSAAIFAKI